MASLDETGIVRHGEGTWYFSRSITRGFNGYDNLEKLRMSIMYGHGEEAVAKCDQSDT